MNFIKLLNFDFIKFLPFQKRPFRAKFIPSQVWDELDAFENNIPGLAWYCKKWRTDIELEVRDVVNVGGCYDPEVNRSTLYIYSPEFPEVCFEPDGMLWDEFKYAFIQTIMHEFIHMMQFNNRFGEHLNTVYRYNKHDDEFINEEREYYSDMDEVRAYAHCIYLDFKSFSDKDVLQLIKGSRGGHNYTYTSILNIFDHNFDNAALKYLVKEIIRIDNRYNQIIGKTHDSVSSL